MCFKMSPIIFTQCGCTISFRSTHFSFQAFNTLHVMYHEATACHVTADLTDLLEIMASVLKVARMHIQKGK